MSIIGPRWRQTSARSASASSSISYICRPTRYGAGTGIQLPVVPANLDASGFILVNLGVTSSRACLDYMNRGRIDAECACGRGGVVGYSLTALFALKLSQPSDTRWAFPEARRMGVDVFKWRASAGASDLKPGALRSSFVTQRFAGVFEAEKSEIDVSKGPIPRFERALRPRRPQAFSVYAFEEGRSPAPSKRDRK